ncbi:DUF2061 domain-containing protein [Ectothiorhodospiraceae bacterium 2226]|nr:DUF2061 domain-containing protein [Ectothiorhodospiraceae bacterium 2226]
MAKTLSFTAMHMSIAFGVAYALTGDVWVGGAVALVEPLVNAVGYHVHEKLWSRRGRRARAHAHPPVAA